MANFVYIAVSLDNYIATRNGGTEWLTDIPNPSGSHFGFGAFMDTLDALIVGRNTCEKVFSFGSWPYEIKVFVLSNTLKRVPENLEGKIELLNGDVVNITTGVNNRGFLNLYVNGGKVIQQFLKKDLIDEMILTNIPVLLGDGIPLFEKLGSPMSFMHLYAEVFNDMLFNYHYIKNNTTRQ